MKVLTEAVKNLGVGYSSPEAEAASKRVQESDVNYYSGALTQEMASDVKTLWKDPGIQTAFKRSSEFQLNDSAGYFF